MVTEQEIGIELAETETEFIEQSNTLIWYVNKHGSPNAWKKLNTELCVIWTIWQMNYDVDLPQVINEIEYQLSIWNTLPPNHHAATYDGTMPRWKPMSGFDAKRIFGEYRKAATQRDVAKEAERKAQKIDDMELNS